jgi:hypothetical protein
VLDGLSLDACDAHLILCDLHEGRLQMLTLRGRALRCGSARSAKCQKAAKSEKAKKRGKRPPHVIDHEPSLCRPVCFRYRGQRDRSRGEAARAEMTRAAAAKIFRAATMWILPGRRDRLKAFRPFGGFFPEKPAALASLWRFRSRK